VGTVSHMLFFLALMLWATTSWYAARVLLYFDFPAQRGVAARNLPRRSSRECTIERKRLLRSIERFWHGIVLNIMNAIC
jgi:hypothetical protein